MKLFLSAVTGPALLVLAACAPADGPVTGEADAFLDNIKFHCGGAYEGRVVSTDEVDDDFRNERLVMHVRECEDDVVYVPFHVGEDRSRTWVLTRTDDGLRLKHDHRHEDGSEDAVTQYGGDTAAPGTANRQEFPVDQFSIDMFEREGLTASVTNVWAMEIERGRYFAYELARENRFLRVEFDLTKPVEPPPTPWGWE